MLVELGRVEEIVGWEGTNITRQAIRPRFISSIKLSLHGTDFPL